MSFLFNNKKEINVNFNGKPVKKIVFNGKTVWQLSANAILKLDTSSGLISSNDIPKDGIEFPLNDTISVNVTLKPCIEHTKDSSYETFYSKPDDMDQSSWKGAGTYLVEQEHDWYYSVKLLINNSLHNTYELYNDEEVELFITSNDNPNYLISAQPGYAFFGDHYGKTYKFVEDYTEKYSIYGEGVSSTANLASASFSYGGCDYSSAPGGTYISGYFAGDVIFDYDAVGSGAYKCTGTVYMNGSKIKTVTYTRDEGTRTDTTIPFNFTMPNTTAYIELVITWSY